MKSEQQTTAAESTEMDKKNAEQQLSATVEALESSNNKIVELESLLASRDEQVAELVHVRAKNSALEEELRAAGSKLAETVDTIEKLNQECSQLKELERDHSSSVDNMVHELQERLDATKQQLSVTEDEKQSTASKLKHVQQLLNSSTEKYSSLLEARTSLQSDFDSMKQAFDQLKQDSLCSHDHTAAVVEECAELKHTVENLTVQHDAVLAEKQAVLQEIADVKELLNGSMKHCEELKTRENILCRGVAELNCTVFDKSVVDNASLLSLSDNDMQDLLSKIHSEVAGLQNKLELQVKQTEDECQLREKVENDKAVLLQEVDSMRASIQSLEEENKQLSSTIKQLETSQAELSERCNAYESQVAQLKIELEVAPTSQDVADEVENTDISPDVTSLQKSVVEKDAEIERLHQEIRAYKMDIERLQQEKELQTVNKLPAQASLLCTYENRNVESQNCEVDDNVGTQQQVFDTNIDENNQGDVVNEHQPSETTVELLNEDQDTGTELLEMKEKMAEWEAMMLMLQTERDEIHMELRKLEQQQKQIFGTIDDVLQCILNSMKGRDLFPSNSEAVGDDGNDGELWGKLALLKTVVDELVFEMDELKEKVHHMTDEVKVSEQRVSELVVERTNLKGEAEEKSVQLQSLRESEDALKRRELELVTEVEHMKTCMSEIAGDLKDKDALLEKLKFVGSDADKLNAEVELLRTEVASKDQLLSDAKLTEETLHRSLTEVKEQLRLNSVESVEIAELKAERDQLSTKVCELQKDNDVMQQQSADMACDLQRKYNDKCSEATELNKTIAAYCKQIEELKEWLKVEVSEKEEVKAQQTKLAGALNDLELHLDQLRAETNNLNAAKITLEQKLCSLQEESEQKVKLSESQISQLEASLSAIHVDYEKTCERKSAVETDLLDCTEKLELTRSRLSQAEDQCSHQTAELLRVRSELDQLKEDCRMQSVQKSASLESVESVQKSSGGDDISDLSTAQVCMCVFAYIYIVDCLDVMV